MAKKKTYSTAVTRIPTKATILALAKEAVKAERMLPALSRDDIRSNPDLKKLCVMLGYRRHHDTRGEAQFNAEHLLCIDGMKVDGFGNMHIDLGDAPVVLWSCHVDSVHKATDSDYKTRQRLRVTRETIALDPACDANCLGADDMAGVWLCLQMIEAKIPGRYVFHRGEEHGGLGSDWIIENTPDMYEGIQFAIAFDRRGTTDIVTNQCVGDCASLEFASSLEDVLGLDYAGDVMGSFTDTANYASVVSECVNLSVGYENEHSKAETLNYNHLFALRDAIVKGWDESKLVALRTPGDFGAVAQSKWYTQAVDGTYVEGYDGMYNNYYQDCPAGDASDGKFDEASYRSVLEIVLACPEAIAELLTDYGIDADDIAGYLTVNDEERLPIRFA